MRRLQDIKKAFTLLELLIVIIILGILAAIAMPRYLANLEKAREAEAISTLNSIRKVELAYYTMHGEYSSALPISVYLTEQATPNIYLLDPQSPNFTFSIQTGYGKAKAATKIIGTKDYYMCLESGKFGTGSISCP